MYLPKISYIRILKNYFKNIGPLISIPPPIFGAFISTSTLGNLILGQ